MTKPYARLPLSEEEFQSLRNAASDRRAQVFKDWTNTPKDDDKQKAFYSERLAIWDGLLEKFQAVLIGDTSQDVPDDEEEEDEAA
jgi:hypothetical protein